MRWAKLLDARTADRPIVRATVHRDAPFGILEELEEEWASARAAIAKAASGVSSVSVEHADWDWRDKIDRVKGGEVLLVALECDASAQGVMALKRGPVQGHLGNGDVIYVDYLETAPWNLRVPDQSPRYLGVGTVLVAEAVRISQENGLGGRLGLHSLPQAEPFYFRIGMTRVGIDAGYFDLPYFEFAAPNAASWLKSIEGDS